MATKSEATVTGRTMQISRLLDAPRALVWEVWTNPEHIRHWFGPVGFTNTISKMDVRPGGEWRFVMHGPDGQDFRNEHHYMEVLEPERLVLQHVTAPKFRMEVNFTEEGGKTRVEIISEFESEEQLTKVIEVFGALKGSTENMDRLENYLQNPVLPLVVERSYQAPVERVWAAITDPAEMKKWYFDLPRFRAEVGYQFQFEGGPPEKTYLHLCEVKAVVPQQKLTYSWRYDGYPGDSLVTFELFAEGEKTRVKLTHSGLESFAAANNPDLEAKNFLMGWTQILGTSLMEFLSVAPGLSFTRLLDAPRDLVFKAWTEPERLAQWWGPKGMELKVLKFDLRPGGIFHYSMTAENGFQMFGRFTFREITAPERLIFINAFADAEGNTIAAPIIENFPLEIYNVLTLTEQNGQTTMTLQGGPLKASESEIATYQGIKENMEQGFGGTFDQLEDYLAKAKG